MNLTSVYIRETNEKKDVRFTSKNKPHIIDEIVNKWQGILNAAAEVLDVPAGLIMKLTATDMEVFVKSENTNNPYPQDGKDTLGHGLYCETVVGNDAPLQVENALADEAWKDNPDVKLGMVAYLGFPLKWRDGEIFGTICVLRDNPGPFSKQHHTLLERFKEAIETDLHNMELIQELRRIARTDPLTKIANRRDILEQVETMFYAYGRNRDPFCVVMLDLNHFKRINDTHGHAAGDRVLTAFASLVKAWLRKTDSIGRLGGDEFLLLLRSTTEAGAKRAVEKVMSHVDKHNVLSKYAVGFTYGIAEMKPGIKSITALIKRADHALMSNKSR